MELTTQLTFDGRCEAAFKFYERHLGAKVEFTLTWGNSPMAGQAPPEWREKILHARIGVGDGVLMGCDVPPGGYEQPKGFSVHLTLNDPADAERKFQALSENGTVRLPLQQTFWALRYGIVVDQFSIPWEIQCENSQSD